MEGVGERRGDGRGGRGEREVGGEEMEGERWWTTHRGRQHLKSTFHFEVGGDTVVFSVERIDTTIYTYHYPSPGKELVYLLDGP